MKEDQKSIVWFNEVTRKDIPLVGGKGANLGEMTNAGIPVPPGFIVTASAYFDFLEKSVNEVGAYSCSPNAQVCPGSRAVTILL